MFIDCEGKVRVGFNALILGSSHLAIFPKNISAITGPDNLRELSGTPGKLYDSTTDPMVSGIWTGFTALANSDLLRGASVAPKSTVFSKNCLIPPPLPIDA